MRGRGRGRGRWILLGAASLACGRGALAAGSSEAAGEPALRATPGFGFAILAGVSLPFCNGQRESCAGGLGPAPSVQGLLLYRPSPTWGFGLGAELTRVHWSTTFGTMIGTTDEAAADLTAGFAGLTTLFSLFPERALTPVVLVTLGWAFQFQSASSFGCNNDGLFPTAELGLGASERIAPSVSAFLLASASTGFKQGFCEVIDGPPAVPFAAWGGSVRIGATFDAGT